MNKLQFCTKQRHATKIINCRLEQDVDTNLPTTVSLYFFIWTSFLSLSFSLASEAQFMGNQSAVRCSHLARGVIGAHGLRTCEIGVIDVYIRGRGRGKKKVVVPNERRKWFGGFLDRRCSVSRASLFDARFFETMGIYAR